MTDLQYQRAAETRSISSPDDSLESLWVKSYQGEILGEILFKRIAEQIPDPERRDKMQVLSTLERRTKEMMVPSLERAGISTDSDPDTLAAAETLAEASVAMSWIELMGTFEPITTKFAAMYARIAELDPSEQAVSDLLVAHEYALREFGRKEVAGDVDESLRAIHDLPHMQ
jgi:hypothetical protein